MKKKKHIYFLDYRNEQAAFGQRKGYDFSVGWFSISDHPLQFQIKSPAGGFLMTQSDLKVHMKAFISENSQKEI